MTIETIIRPFTLPIVNPAPFIKPGTVGVEDVHVKVGMKGGTKTFSCSVSKSQSSKMGNAHKEKNPASQSLQRKLQQASDQT